MRTNFKLVALAVGLLSASGMHAQSWQITVGGQSDDKARQAIAFLPNETWVHAGDSVTWTVASDEIHTITFLKPSQVRPTFQVGCPGITQSGSSFDGDECVNSGALAKGKVYTVVFPEPGNYKLVCLVHANMTGVVHVLPVSEPLPYDQAFYDQQGAAQREDLLSDFDTKSDHHSAAVHSHPALAVGTQVNAGIGEIVATAGGTQDLAVMRFTDATVTIHAGQTVEWTNTDPVANHTITFGKEPKDLVDPSPNVFLDDDGARHAILDPGSPSVHSGFIGAAPQERVGLKQAPVRVTRFRVTFPMTGTFPYICALHDQLGMKGTVIVIP